MQSPYNKQDYIKTENGVIPTIRGFDEVEYLSNSLFKVGKGGKYGICNSTGKIIVNIVNEDIDCLESSFIISYNQNYITVYNYRGDIILERVKGQISSIFAINKYLFLYMANGTSLYNLKGELIWKIETWIHMPEIIRNAPLSNLLKFHKNINEEGIITTEGKIIVPCNDWKISYEKVFFVTKHYDRGGDLYLYGLYDILGNHLLEEIYCKISIQDNCVIAREYWGDTFLIDFSGKVIFAANDIVPTGNGLYVVRTWNQEQRTFLDGVIDSCGNEILPCVYHRIEAYKDGFFYISRSIYGREKGQLDERLIYSKGLRKLSLFGNIEVLNEKESVWLPSEYNWGTDFVNGLAIVRNNIGVGVIDTNRNSILETKFSKVSILDNFTILINSIENDYCGIADYLGNIIVPVKYKRIRQIKENRYLANLDEMWHFYDNKGKIISDEKFAGVCDFKYSYKFFDILCAVVYKSKQKINEYGVRYSQGGVINEDGDELLPCIYDKVTLHPPHYAFCWRNKTFSLANLSSNKQIAFPKLNIKHVFYIDKFGRCIFSDDCVYNDKKEKWEGGTKGVLSFDGILVPTGKYEEIDLLDNGLIRVGSDPCDVFDYDEDDYINEVYSHYQKWGIVNQTGDEIVPMEYSKISDFINGYATICQGGKFIYLSGIMIRDGRWGVINEKGDFVIPCVHDSESFHNLVQNKSLKKNEIPASTGKEFPPHPNTILSLSFSVPSNSSGTEIEYLNGNWDGDEVGSGYTEYEINQMYRDAFENNPELEWNID